MIITLIFPGIAGIGFNCLGRRPWTPETHLIHHGLASLGASLQAAGHSVDLIDLRALRDWGDVRAAVQARTSGLWGISVASPDRDIALRCAAIVRDEHPTAHVVVGGVHPTVAPVDFVGHPAVGTIVQGEGEITLVELAEALERGKPVPRIVRGTPPDLDVLPFVERELFNIHAELDNGFYPQRLGLPTPMITLIASRGCRYNCSFCQPVERRLFGPKVRCRSVENVLSELRLLRDRYTFRSLMIYDDNFLEDHDWALAFCDAYQAEGFQQPWFCQARADLVVRDEALVARLAEVGLAAISIGFESGSDRVLRLLRKGTTVEQNRQAARVCRKYGIRIFGSFMLGLPTETPEEMMATARLVREIAPALVNLSLYAPSPGSDLYEICRRDGLLLADDPVGYYRDRQGGKVRGVDYTAAHRAIAHALGLSPARRALYRATTSPLARRAVEPLRRFRLVQQGLDVLRRYLNRP